VRQKELLERAGLLLELQVVLELARFQLPLDALKVLLKELTAASGSLLLVLRLQVGVLLTDVHVQIT
jgi:hypothetical protein